MAKALTEEGYVDRVTVRQAVKNVVWARNCQLTVSGYSPLEIATGRRPPDLFDIETSTPEQLSAEPLEEDRTMLQLQRIALRAHQEARQALDLRKDIARRVMPSDGPYPLGDKVLVWMKDESKKKAEGIWVRGKVVSQEGARVLAQVHKSVLRVNQSVSHSVRIRSSFNIRRIFPNYSSNIIFKESSNIKFKIFSHKRIAVYKKWNPREHAQLFCQWCKAPW